MNKRNRLRKHFGVVAVLALFSAVIATTASAAGAAEACPTDAQAGYAVDSDGDGWGWVLNNANDASAGGRSCQVQEGSSAPVTTPEPSNPVSNPSTGSDCVWDWAEYNDGWGWNPTNSSETCPPTHPNAPGNAGSGNPGSGNPDNSGSSNIEVPDSNDIVLLFGGQSNSIASRNSSVETANGVRGLDGLAHASGKVFVDVPAEGGFVDANLCDQKWDNQAGQSNNWPATPSGTVNAGAACGNHAGFQMAAELARTTNKDVFLIATGTEGAPIETWIGKPMNSSSFNSCLGTQANEFDFDGRTGGTEVARLAARVNDRVPAGVTIAAVGWIQGEGNAQSGTLGALRHKCKVQHLLDELDSASNRITFGAGGTKFIAASIREFAPNIEGKQRVNQALRQASAAEGTSWMRVFTPSCGLGHLPGDMPHFNDNAIRQIGIGMANEFRGANDQNICNSPHQ